MSHLIKRFKEDLQLAGYAKRSNQSYVSSVLRLQRFYNKPLEDITEEELRQYWLCCQSEFGWSAAHLSGPGTFLMKSNGNVSKRFPPF